MPTFHEIDERILQLVDEETGELLDAAEFEALQMEREKKAENMALWALQLESDAESIKREIARLAARQHAAENKARRLREYLQYVLNGEALKTSLVSVSYRRSRAVEISDEEAVIRWAQTHDHDEEILHYKQPEISKAAVRQAIEEGAEIPGAAVVTRVNMIVR